MFRGGEPGRRRGAASRHAVAGSGLLTGPVEWVGETQRILAAEKPDVVVAEFVGNYRPAAYVRPWTIAGRAGDR